MTSLARPRPASETTADASPALVAQPSPSSAQAGLAVGAAYPAWLLVGPQPSPAAARERQVSAESLVQGRHPVPRAELPCAWRQEPWEGGPSACLSVSPPLLLSLPGAWLHLPDPAEPGTSRVLPSVGWMVSLSHQLSTTEDMALTRTFLEEGYTQPWDKFRQHSHFGRCLRRSDQGQSRAPGASLALPAPLA